MALEGGPELAVALQELLLGDHACRPEHRVQQRRGMALREHEVVVGREVRPVPVVAKVAAHEDRHEVGRRQRRRGMTRARGGAAPDGVHTQLAREQADVLERLSHQGSLLRRSGSPLTPEALAS